MRRFVYIFVAFAIGNFAKAADFGGVTVNGEASFDYYMLSAKDKGIPFINGASNETYRLNQAQMVIKKDTEKISFLSRLVYSPTTYATSSTATSHSNFSSLDQLEIFYRPTPILYIGFGRLLTTMGYESAAKSENTTYGNTIAYQGIVPGYGEGLRAKYIPGDWLTATISTYNQATYNAFGDDYTPTKTTEISATGLLGKFTWFVGYYFGKDGATPAERAEKTSSSVWATYKILEPLTVGVTYDSRTNKLDSAGLKWSDSTSFLVNYIVGINTLTARYEMVRGAGELVDLSTNLNYGSADKVNSLTLSDKIALDEYFRVYVEYRNDHADQKAFFDANGNLTDKADLWILGALASF